MSTVFRTHSALALNLNERMDLKNTLFILCMVTLGLTLSACEDDPEFNITQNILFLVGDEGKGKSWKLVRAEVPVELQQDPSPVIYNILQHPDFNCYSDDTLTFFLQDSLWLRLGDNSCTPLFDAGARNTWQMNENPSSDEADILLIRRTNQDLTIEYNLPISLLNRERLISDLVLPLKQPLNLTVDGVEVSVYELDLTLEFESLGGE